MSSGLLSKSGRLTAVGSVRAWFLFTLIAPLFVLTWDLVSATLNPTIIYAAILGLGGVVGPDRKVWRVAFLLVLLTFVGFILKSQFLHPESFRDVFYCRLSNRMILGVCLIIMAALLSHGGLRGRDTTDAIARDEFDALFESVRAAIAVGVALMLIVVVAIADILTQPRLNLPILYTVPLFILGWGGSRRVIWAITAFCAIAAVAGYFLTPGGAHASLQAGTGTLFNRTLVIPVLAMLAWVSTLLARPAAAVPHGDGGDGTDETKTAGVHSYA